MGQEGSQNKQGGQHFQIISWVIAIVFISLLGACCIANCLVTHTNFLRCRRSTEVSKLGGHRINLTCIEEKSDLKGNTWNCCPIGWRAFQSSCYFPFHDNKTWAESGRNCTRLGAHLVTISTEAEQNFITQFLDRRFSYFLGLSHENPEGLWQWVDRMPFNSSMEFWHKGEPNNHQKENCVVLVNDQNKWAWNGFSCTLRQAGFVRNLEEYLPESYEEVLVMWTGKKNPLDQGRMYMHQWNRENILDHRTFSIMMGLIYSIHSR